MRALLDVNVLLALMDSAHVHHAASLAWWRNERDNGWSSCPLTQNGFVRIVCQGKYPKRPTAAQAIEQLRLQLAEPGHEFWPDDVSIAEAALFDRRHILGPKQISDVYLLGTRGEARRPARHLRPQHSAARRARRRAAACGGDMMKSAERGTIDDAIMPHATRARVARALAMLRGKTVELPGRRHDNLPV